MVREIPSPHAFGAPQKDEGVANTCVIVGLPVFIAVG